MVAGLAVSLLTLWGDPGPVALHLFAGILVLTGIGLRIEAAITAPRK